MHKNHFPHVYCFAVLFVKRVVKLMLRKQPRIVCTLFNLASQQIDGYSPQWNMIKSIVARNIDIIKVNILRRKKCFAHNSIGNLMLTPLSIVVSRKNSISAEAIKTSRNGFYYKWKCSPRWPPIWMNWKNLSSSMIRVGNFKISGFPGQHRNSFNMIFFIYFQ